MVVIGSSHRRRAKSPLGTVLIINLLGKGLTPRACMGDGGSIWWAPERTHPRRPKGSQSGQEKRRDESFQVRAKEPLGTDSHRTISKNASRCRLLIGHKKYFVFILCLIGEQFLLSSFREFVYDGYLDHGLSGSCTKEMKAVRKLSVWYKTPIWFQNIVCRKTKDAFPKIQAWACFAMWRYC